MLGKRHHRRRNGCRRVATAAAVDVVVVKGMTGGAVDERRLAETGLLARAKHRRLRAAALLFHLLEKDARQRLVHPRQRDPDEIHQALLGDGDRFRRESFETRVDDALRDACGGAARCWWHVRRFLGTEGFLRVREWICR